MRRPRPSLPPPPGQTFPPLRWLLPVLAALALVVGALVLRVMLPRLNLSRDDSATQAPLVLPPSARSAPRQPPRERTPPETPTEEARLGPLSHHALGPVMHFHPKVRIQMPIEPLDARTFRDAHTLILLAHVATPSLQAICRDDEQRLWHCGIHARAGLYNRIRRGTLTCRTLSGDGSGAGQWRCDHDGEDLGLVLVRLGWAKPAAGAPLAYFSEADAARADKRGLWNGNWTIHTPNATSSPLTAPSPAETTRRTRRRTAQPSAD